MELCLVEFGELLTSLPGAADDERTGGSTEK